MRAKAACYISLTLLGILPLLPAIRAQQQTREVPVDGLIYDLKNPDPVRRKEAATILGNKKIQRAVPDLVAAAGDTDPAVRREVVIALDKMLDMRALPAFVQLSGDAEKDIRGTCISGITNLYLPKAAGVVATFNKVTNFLNPWSDEWADVIVERGIVADPSAVSALEKRLGDEDEGIRVRSARALGILRGREATSALLQAMQQDRSNSVRFEAVRALRKIGDPAVAGSVMNYITYADSKVRDESIFTIGRLKYAAGVPELTRIYEHQASLPKKQRDKAYQERLLEALSFIAAPESRELFIRESRNPEEQLRLHAYEGLARIGDAAMVTDISRDRLHESDARVKTAQAFALYRMGRREYLDEVAKALGSGKTNSDARQYLVETPPAQMQDLYGLARLDDVAVREGVAEILGLIGTSEAVPVLQELSKDRRGNIAALANQALRRINALPPA